MILKENMFIEPKMKISGLTSGQTTDFMFIEPASAHHCCPYYVNGLSGLSGYIRQISGLARFSGFSGLSGPTHFFFSGYRFSG